VSGKIYTPANTWYHLAYVYKGTSVYIYVNGVLSTSGSSGGFPASSTLNTNRVYNFFGRDLFNNFGNVQLDEIKIYNKALSLAQVQLDMNTVGIPSCGVC
jgi:hypothetical protein